MSFLPPFSDRPVDPSEVYPPKHELPQGKYCPLTISRNFPILRWSRVGVDSPLREHLLELPAAPVRITLFWVSYQHPFHRSVGCDQQATPGGQLLGAYPAEHFHRRRVVVHEQGGRPRTGQLLQER